MRCTSCDEELPAVVRRCPSCGDPAARWAPAVPPAQAGAPAEERHGALVATGVVLAALGAFMLPLFAIGGIVLGALAHRRGDARGRIVVMAGFAGLVIGLVAAYLYST